MRPVKMTFTGPAVTAALNAVTRDGGVVERLPEGSPEQTFVRWVTDAGLTRARTITVEQAVEHLERMPDFDTANANAWATQLRASIERAERDEFRLSDVAVRTDEDGPDEHALHLLQEQLEAASPLLREFSHDLRVFAPEDGMTLLRARQLLAAVERPELAICTPADNQEAELLALSEVPYADQTAQMRDYYDYLSGEVRHGFLTDLAIPWEHVHRFVPEAHSRLRDIVRGFYQGLPAGLPGTGGRDEGPAPFWSQRR